MVADAGGQAAEHGHFLGRRGLDAPHWVGNNRFWSQDMCDYYVKWIKGLKTAHGLDLDAIGCRNEKGVDEGFIKRFKTTLNAAGLGAVKLHGFDNWDKTKFDFVRHMPNDPALKAAVDIVSNHTMATAATPPDVRKMLDEMGKPIWNSEEHVYKEGFDCEISLVEAFNKNFLVSGVTKIVNWYLVASIYPIEPFPETPALLIAREPWSGNFTPRTVLWGYAHYGQFSQIGWQYLNGGCGNLDGGGTFVTLKSPGADYSVIAETKGAKAAQKLTFKVGGGLSSGKLCVWRSNAREQFVRLDDITPADGAFTVTLEPNAIYSISTTTGQQKGSFANIPPSKPFPLPYYDDFHGYTSGKAWGYLPHYLADITGIFEIADRPDGTGKCVRQVLKEKAQSWAPEWMPYTIFGDKGWKDYEVSADVYLDDGGFAGVMGRVSNTGSGYGCTPKGYYLRLATDGTCSLYVVNQGGGRNAGGQSAEGTQLATGKAANVAGKQWHNLKLQLSGSTLKGFVDKKEVLTASNGALGSGMAGLVTGGAGDARNTALFGNLIVNTVNGREPKPTEFPQNGNPIYEP